MQTIARLAILSIWGAPAAIALLVESGFLAPDVAGAYAFVTVLSVGAIALIASSEVDAELQPVRVPVRR